MKIKGKPISSFSKQKLMDMLESLVTPKKDKQKIKNWMEGK